MKHEELLARINEIATVKFSEVELESTWTRLCKLPEALRAVVDLHKPVDCKCTDGIPHLLRCVGCTTEKFALAYPCPTIQAIEKELK